MTDSAGRGRRKRRRPPPAGAVDRWCGAGRDALAGGEHAEAARLFDRALKLDHGSLPAHVGKIIALMHLGPGDETMRALDEAISRFPDELMFWANKGACLGLTERRAEALVCFERALELAPEEAGCWFNKGQALLGLHRFEEAASCFARAVELAPDEAAESLERQINALYHLGRYDEALKCAQRLLTLAGEDAERVRQARELLSGVEDARARKLPPLKDQPDFWCARAEEAFRSGRLEDALALLDRASSLDPRLERPHVDRGLMLDEAGRPEDAIGCYDRALALNPKSLVALTSRGNSLCHAGRFEDALASFDEALALGPRDGAAILGRINCLASLACPERILGLVQAGDLLERAREYGKALEVYRRALALEPRAAIALAGRANCLLFLDRHPQAIKAFDAALRVNPHHPMLWSNKGLSLAVTGKLDVALRMFEAAIRLAPGLAFPRSNRGEALFQLGWHAEALEAFDEALELDDGFPNALYGKAQTLAALDRADEAEPYCRRFLEVAGPQDAEKAEAMRKLLPPELEDEGGDDE